MRVREDAEEDGHVERAGRRGERQAGQFADGEVEVRLPIVAPAKIDRLPADIRAEIRPAIREVIFQGHRHLTRAAANVQ
jgi:hypothetical protein